MARRRRSFRKIYSRSKGSIWTGNSGNMIATAVSSAIYGAIRQPIADKIPPFMGDFTDEVVLGAPSGLVAAFTTGKVRSAAMVPFVIESARAVEKIKVKLTTGGTGSGSSGLAYL